MFNAKHIAADAKIMLTPCLFFITSMVRNTLRTYYRILTALSIYFVFLPGSNRNRDNGSPRWRDELKRANECGLSKKSFTCFNQTSCFLPFCCTTVISYILSVWLNKKKKKKNYDLWWLRQTTCFLRGGGF